MSKSSNPFLHILDNHNRVLWLALAFHAGYLNAGGFLACHRFVSHMTGVGTSIGISVSELDYGVALEMVLAPIFFMLGSVYAGILVDRKVLQARTPQVIQGVLSILVLNLIVFLGGIYGYFGPFGEPLEQQRDFILLFLMTFICGLQNGMFTSLTAGQIRTTHITGLVTDIGLNIAKRSELKKNYLRAFTVIAFSFGSLISAMIFQNIGYWGFAGSTIFSIFIVLLVLSILVRKDPVSVAS